MGMLAARGPVLLPRPGCMTLPELPAALGAEERPVPHPWTWVPLLTGAGHRHWVCAAGQGAAPPPPSKPGAGRLGAGPLHTRR